MLFRVNSIWTPKQVYGHPFQIWREVHGEKQSFYWTVSLPKLGRTSRLLFRKKTSRLHFRFWWSILVILVQHNVNKEETMNMKNQISEIHFSRLRCVLSSHSRYPQGVFHKFLEFVVCSKLNSSISEIHELQKVQVAIWKEQIWKLELFCVKQQENSENCFGAVNNNEERQDREEKHTTRRRNSKYSFWFFITSCFLFWKAAESGNAQNIK